MSSYEREIAEAETRASTTDDDWTADLPAAPGLYWCALWDVIAMRWRLNVVEARASADGLLYTYGPGSVYPGAPFGVACLFGPPAVTPEPPRVRHD